MWKLRVARIRYRFPRPNSSVQLCLALGVSLWQGSICWGGPGLLVLQEAKLAKP